ncbi:MAG: 16S rRNA (cytidine(1402)-2'-O)-methyltransferase [Deltaproteobacteria bacterium]|nr:16S rRNA (cytidine(1402)-2'-O)-methyltransferase [Deltaproteobacteria bacterium]
MVPNGKGTLCVVATPLGNLKDITLRALEVLKGSDLIAAEDTRRTQKLLSAYDLHVPLISFNENNQYRKIPFLIERLKQGQQVSLVTDGGTPGISDPGRELVRETRQARITVVPIPGPSALICALSVSGLPGDSFIFLGFLPRRKSRRKRILQEMKEQKRTVIFYEAPHRIRDLLKEIEAVLGEREVTLTRELTKIHEEIISGPVSELLRQLADREPKGEYTLLLAPEEKESSEFGSQAFVYP